MMFFGGRTAPELRCRIFTFQGLPSNRTLGALNNFQLEGGWQNHQLMLVKPEVNGISCFKSFYHSQEIAPFKGSRVISEAKGFSGPKLLWRQKAIQGKKTAGVSESKPSERHMC